MNDATLEQLRMAIEMVAADDAFFTKEDGVVKLCLNMNDVWAWATADGESVEWQDVPSIHEIWKSGGENALLVWACKKRNAKPQRPLFAKLPPEVQKQLEHLPRFGDMTYPVGDGKSVTFDDGWKEEQNTPEPAPRAIRSPANGMRSTGDENIEILSVAEKT